MDTPSKRFSAMRWQQPYGNAMPPVDGSISVGDRFHWMFQYGGIAIGAAVVEVVPVVEDVPRRKGGGSPGSKADEDELLDEEAVIVSVVTWTISHA